MRRRKLLAGKAHAQHRFNDIEGLASPVQGNWHGARPWQLAQRSALHSLTLHTEGLALAIAPTPIRCVTPRLFATIARALMVGLPVVSEGDLATRSIR